MVLEANCLSSMVLVQIPHVLQTDGGCGWSHLKGFYFLVPGESYQLSTGTSFGAVDQSTYTWPHHVA